MKRLRLLLTLMLTMIPASFGWSYPWDKDMVDQPAEKAQESVAPPGPGSVPITGGETLPLPLTDNEAADMKDAAAALQNPVEASVESIARGKYFY